MIDIERVIPVLAVLSGADSEELEQISPVIGNAVYVVSRLVKEEEHNSDRAVYLAGAKANYDLSLIRNCDNVTSFSAGDVSITQDRSYNPAKEILDETIKNASDIICDNGFAFMGV